MSAYPISKTVPISVIDTDFERHDIDNAEANFVENLQLWQQEGSEWSQEISAQSNGYYI